MRPRPQILELRVTNPRPHNVRRLQPTPTPITSRRNRVDHPAGPNPARSTNLLPDEPAEPLRTVVRRPTGIPRRALDRRLTIQPHPHIHTHPTHNARTPTLRQGVTGGQAHPDTRKSNVHSPDMQPPSGPCGAHETFEALVSHMSICPRSAASCVSRRASSVRSLSRGALPRSSTTSVQRTVPSPSVTAHPNRAQVPMAALAWVTGVTPTTRTYSTPPQQSSHTTSAPGATITCLTGVLKYR